MNGATRFVSFAAIFATIIITGSSFCPAATSAGLVWPPPSGEDRTANLTNQGDDRPPMRRTVGHAPPAPGGAGETWTLLFYDDADFSGYDPLEHFANDTASGDHLNVLVLQDGYGDPAELYHVGADHTLTMLEDWGEANMGSYVTLRDFIAFGKANYPADRYLLAVYDHGMAWDGACIDSTDGDWLRMDEFKQALEATGGVDILAFTAPCTMGAMESVYELKDQVELYIGSENFSGYILWFKVMEPLCAMLNTPPQPSVLEIGEEIIRLAEENNVFWVGEYYTLSAIRTDRVDAAAAALDQLAADLLDRLPGCLPTLSQARGMAKHFNTESWYNRAASSDVDIVDFARQMAAVETDPVLLADLEAVIQAFGEAVVAEMHGTRIHEATGLTLYFPCDGRYHDPTYNTTGLDFVHDLGWDELLDAYYEHAPLTWLFTGPGPAQANPPLLRTYNAFAPQTPLAEVTAYGVSANGLNVAAGDLYDGSVPMVITGPGPGAVFGPHVRVFSPLGTPVPGASFLAYGTHQYGVNVASGNVDAEMLDTYDDIITGPGPGPVFGPHVRGWNFELGGTVTPIPGLSFFAYGTNRYGVNVACGNLNGGDHDEILTGPGPGAVFGPHVRGWRYWAAPQEVEPLPNLSFFAYGTHRLGVNVACADVDGDRKDEIITAPGPGSLFPAHIRGWDYVSAGVTPMEGINFLAYPSAMYGARISAMDLDQDGIDEIITVPGPDPGWGARVRAWKLVDGVIEPVEDIDFDAYGDLGLAFGGDIAGGGS